MREFKKYDYVFWADGQMNGYLDEYLGDDIWDVQYTAGTGGGNFHIHESELKHGGEMPDYYKEIIEQFR